MPNRPLTTEEDRARLVLNALLRYYALSNADFARRVGTTRQTVHEKIKGESLISLSDAVRYADALDIDPRLFFMEPNDALRWVLDNAPSRQAGFVTVRSALAGTLALITGLAAGHGAAPVAMLVGAVAENVCPSDQVMSGDVLPVAA